MCFVHQHAPADGRERRVDKVVVPLKQEVKTRRNFRSEEVDDELACDVDSGSTSIVPLATILTRDSRQKLVHEIDYVSSVKNR